MPSRNAAADEPGAGEQQLIEAALRGDTAAFGKLVERYQTAVSSFAYALSGSSVQSEEIAQDVFLTAWRRLSDFQTRASFGAWLYGITQNVSRNAHRKWRVGASARAKAGVVEADLPAAGPSPLDWIIRREEERLLWSALREIPETYRVPLVLFYRDELSLEGVAHALGLTETGVKTRLMRGRRMLQEHVVALRKSAAAPRVSSNRLAATVLALIAARPPQEATAGSKARRLGAAAVPVALCAVAVVQWAGGTSAGLRSGPRQGPPARGMAPATLASLSPTVLSAADDRGAAAARSSLEDNVIYSFDFEDGILPPVFQRGHVVAPPPGNSSRHCLRGTVNLTWGDSQSVQLATGADASLYTYSPDAVLSFDYWIGKDYSDWEGTGEECQVYLHNADQKQNYSILYYGYVPEKWGHFEEPLAKFRGGVDRSRPQEPGDRIDSISIDAGKITGKPFFIDNVRLFSRAERGPPPSVGR